LGRGPPSPNPTAKQLPAARREDTHVVVTGDSLHRLQLLQVGAAPPRPVRLPFPAPRASATAGVRVRACAPSICPGAAIRAPTRRRRCAAPWLYETDSARNGGAPRLHASPITWDARRGARCPSLARLGTGKAVEPGFVACKWRCGVLLR
jgi:hypothetical protein